MAKGINVNYFEPSVSHVSFQAMRLWYKDISVEANWALLVTQR